jgi:hypothetical protein
MLMGILPVKFTRLAMPHQTSMAMALNHEVVVGFTGGTIK